MFLGEVKARPIDIISSSLGHQSKCALQTSSPSPGPAPLDTLAKPADFVSGFTMATPFLRWVMLYIARFKGVYFHDVLMSCHQGVTRGSFFQAVFSYFIDKPPANLESETRNEVGRSHPDSGILKLDEIGSSDHRGSHTMSTTRFI